MIPLKIRRSSLRLGPGWLEGKCGTIFAHCSSLNQNKFASMAAAPQWLTKTLNQKIVNQVLTLGKSTTCESAAAPKISSNPLLLT
jgi:hypothetical protein